jgi:hypothetical protein
LLTRRSLLDRGAEDSSVKGAGLLNNKERTMKKLILVVCSFLLITAIASGLWRAAAVNRQKPSLAMKMDDEGIVSAAEMQKLAQESQLIVTGQCLNTRSAWIERSLVTVATVEVSETIKGSPSSAVDVVLPGGIDTNRKFPIAMTYPGAPVIQSKEDALLFLKPSDRIANSYVVTRFADGKFSIVSDDRGQKMVSRDLIKVPLRSGARAVRGNRQVTPLSELKEKIKQYIR